MTRAEYKAHFEGLLQGNPTIKIADIPEHVNRAIEAGLRKFWGASNWSFKETETTIDVSATATSYSLPDDFEAFRAIWEESSTRGRKIQHYARERWVELLPKLESYATGTPRSCCIYRDEANGEWVISFHPRPSGGETIKLAYYLTTCSEPELVLDKYQSALESCIAWHCYPFGHPGRADAKFEAAEELRQAETVDKIDQSDFDLMPTEGTDQGTIPSQYGWIDR